MAERMKKPVRTGIIWLVLLAAWIWTAMATAAPGACCAESGIKITIEEEEWSWEPGGVATFTGTLTADPEQAAGAILQVSINPEPKAEDPGRIVFTNVNGKKVKVRKQDAVYTLDTTEAEGEIPFSGSWFLPDDSAYFRAAVTVSLINAEGEILASSNMKCGVYDTEGESTLKRIPADIGKINMILALSAGGIWCLAILRIAICRGRKQNRKDPGAL